MTALWVLLGGALGAPLRYLVDQVIQSRHDSLFPWGTFTVNVAGSLVLGATVAAGSVLGPWVLAGVGTGVCGALTTFSTFGYETVRLVQDGALLTAVANACLSVAVALAACAAGYAAVGALV